MLFENLFEVLVYFRGRDIQAKAGFSVYYRYCLEYGKSIPEKPIPEIVLGRFSSSLIHF